MTATSTSIQEISIAHSPDSDDAFMFYGLATNKVRVPGFKFNHTLTDIETLNHFDGLRRQRWRGLRSNGRRQPKTHAG
jgi:hypothetical protein